MSDAAIPFPTRPLKVHPPGSGIGSVFLGVLWSVLLAGGAILIVVPPIPDLLTDFSIRRAAQPVPEASVENGRCTVHVLVMTDCEATLVLQRKGQDDLRRTVHDWFFDFHRGGYSVTVVADPARPEQMTTDLALTKVWNRALTLLLLGPLFLLLGALAVKYFIFGPVRERRAVVRALSNQVLRLVLLRLDRRETSTWTVSYATPAGTTRTCEWSSKLPPIIMDPAQHLILGVTAGDGTMCMPLDPGLSWIELTEAERTQLRQALGPHG